MKIIKTKQFEKIAANWDDQPNFDTTRDNTDQGQVLFNDTDDIVEDFLRRKKMLKDKEKKQFSDRIKPYNVAPEDLPKGSL